MTYTIKVNVILTIAIIAFLAIGAAIMLITPTLVPGAATWGMGLGWTVSVPMAYEWIFPTAAMTGVSVWIGGSALSAHLVGKYVN